MTKQAEFDIESLIRETDIAAGPAWEGAPLQYQEDYYSPAALDAAWERWSFENGSFGCIPRSHMWHRQSYRQYPTLIGSNSSDHQLDLFRADARCDGKRFGHPDHTHAPGEIPGTYQYQAICEPCQWHAISNRENNLVEAWHDHAFPGWRSLPAVPLALTQTQGKKNYDSRLQTWLEEHYSEKWRQHGCPIITERESYAGRHIAGRSPWGGFDLGSPA